MKEILIRFVERIGKTGLLFLFFIPFGVWGLYYNGLPGFLAAACGWCLGNAIYNWKENKQRLKKFFRHNTQFKVKAIIFIPIAAAASYCYGWRGFPVVCAGWCVGELICRRFLKLK